MEDSPGEVKGSYFQAAEEVCGRRRLVEAVCNSCLDHEAGACEACICETGPATESQKHLATLVSGLSNVAWSLNLRGHDIPFNLVFKACLFVSLEAAVLFVEG